MTTPAKRSNRPRRDSARKELVSERPDSSSSPTRPAKRRKKDHDSSKDVADDEDGSSLLDSSPKVATLDGMVAMVAAHFLTPADTVQASKDHANDNHETGIQAYAKIVGADWTYFVQRLHVNLGRSSDPPQPIDDEDDPRFIHIDLGPSKLISRQHARISYDSTLSSWILHVNGRNAVKIDRTTIVKQSQDAPLRSGQVLEISGIEMMFVLPSAEPMHVDPVFLARAGLSAKDFLAQAGPVGPVSSTANLTSPSQGVGQARSGRGHQQIAPAPPNYKRPSTPLLAKSRPQSSQTQLPQVRNSAGTIVMNTSDVDLSLDENRNLKPQYSYSQMITQAIMNTADEKLNLSGIYKFITENYAYYRHQEPKGWQNSIRHNLSLKKSEFFKTARTSEEPGKGSKWCIVPEAREDMIRNAWKGGRGGHRGSSNPSSPSQLNYITQGPRDMAAKDPGSSRKRRISPTGSPLPRSTLRLTHATPDRSAHRFEREDPALPGDGSPMPPSPSVRRRRSSGEGSANASETGPRSPVLTSSYTQDESSFVTPAPHRVHPKLAPPSTAPRPSQHMPTSSPAPFWKYADIGSTPLKPAQLDSSPSKHLATIPGSSSPPRVGKSPVASPIPRWESDTKGVAEKDKDMDAEEDGGFDLTKGFQSIGSYHAPASHGQAVPRANGDPMP